MHVRTHFRRRLRLLAVLMLLLAAFPAAQATANPVIHEAVFEFTGHPQVFEVPEGVTQVTVDAYGASATGAGGRVTAAVPVTPREPLFVYVGGQPGPNGEGGWNGGGAGGCYLDISAQPWHLPCVGLTLQQTLGGGGASDVRQGGSLTADDGRIYSPVSPVDHRVVVAGGGGGGTGGGAGGGASGESGPPLFDGGCTTPAYGGEGGSSGSDFASGGGGSYHRCITGGIYASCGGEGAPGTAWKGGDGATGYLPGGGGGGGYGAGGGGGSSDGPTCWPGAGGGGGAGYVAPTAQLLEWATGVHTGHGRVVITWEAPASQPLPVPDVLPDDLPDVLPGDSSACGDETWHFDRVSGDGAGYTYEIDIHNTPTDVEVCTTITNPAGHVIFDHDVIVPKDSEPSDYLPPYDSPTVESDAPDGEAPGSPCTQSSGTGQGTDSVRGYARTGQSGSDTIVCVGFRSPAAQRHVRVTIH